MAIDSLWVNLFRPVQFQLLTASLDKLKYKYFNCPQAEESQDSKTYIAS
jgi:hypothetical protein